MLKNVVARFSIFIFGKSTDIEYDLSFIRYKLKGITYIYTILKLENRHRHFHDFLNLVQWYEYCFVLQLSDDLKLSFVNVIFQIYRSVSKSTHCTDILKLFQL